MDGGMEWMEGCNGWRDGMDGGMEWMEVGSMEREDRD